jgi:hypothetical protein
MFSNVENSTKMSKRKVCTNVIQGVAVERPGGMFAVHQWEQKPNSSG